MQAAIIFVIKRSWGNWYCFFIYSFLPGNEHVRQKKYIHNNIEKKTDHKSIVFLWNLFIGEVISTLRNRVYKSDYGALHIYIWRKSISLKDEPFSYTALSTMNKMLNILFFIILPVITPPNMTQNLFVFPLLFTNLCTCSQYGHSNKYKCNNKHYKT